MKRTPLDELLADALSQCAQDFPHAKHKLDAFNEALERMEERDEHGNLTRAAHDARQYLRSDLLDMRPYQRAKKEVEKQKRKARAKAETAIAQALAAYVVYKQWDIEAGLLSDRDDGTKLVPKSREEHSRDGVARIVEPFIQDMIERGVTPSAIARRRTSEADVIARLIQSAHDDPQYEDPDNPWIAIHQAGLFDAYRTGLTEDEARLLDIARVLQDDEAQKALEEARKFLPDGVSVSTGVALGAARIMHSVNTLSDGLAQAYADAHNLVRDKDAEQVGRLLGIESESGLLKLQALLNFVRAQSVSTYPELPTWIEIDVMRRVIDNANAHVKPASEWVGNVTAKLGKLAEIYGERLNSQDGFYALLNAAMHSSYTFRHFESDRSSKDAELARLRLFRETVLEGKSFKIDQFGYPVAEDDEDYDDIDAEVFRTVNCGSDDAEVGIPDRVAPPQEPGLSVPLLSSEHPLDNSDAEQLSVLSDETQRPDHTGFDYDDDEGEEVNFYALLAEAEDEPGADEPDKMTTPTDPARSAQDPMGVDDSGAARKSSGDPDEEFEALEPETPRANPGHAVSREDQFNNSPIAADSDSENAPIRNTPKRAKPLFGSEEEVWEDD